MDLKEFLSSKYSTGNFENFIRESFYNLEIQDSSYTDEYLSENEKKHIQDYRYLGQVELDDGKEIGFFEFHSASSHIENKRVGYNTILKKLAKDYILDGAIASFSHNESKVWRLSFVGIDYDAGKVTVSNLKRYTYVLGENIPIKTPLTQLKNLKSQNLNEIEKAFSVEALNDKFFKDYKELFISLNNYLLENNFANFARDEENIRAFNKKLLGRLTFLYFLQKKGWLGVKENWGDGDKNFLQNSFSKRGDKNFYEEYLKAIFFNGLNSKRENDNFELLECKIPFLNGGLFESKEFDNEFLHIDNAIFENIFNVFSSYNFTIIEDLPHDSEVAVDPEMLGKVFENLLEDNYKSSKGAFYTPREIVHFMCKESIFSYLVSDFTENEEAIRELIFKGNSDDIFFRDAKNARAVEEKIKSIKVLDPAIGSGAFPMGMLLELVEALQSLNRTLDTVQAKIDIIEQSIYGIDIDASAVEIAKLRFWLSIVVDEVKPTPLPNLFYKIMVGNSLLETINGFDPLAKDSSSLFNKDEVLIDEIQELLHRFYYTHINKKELQAEIDNKIDEILNKKLDNHQDELRSQVNDVSILGFDKKQTLLVEKLTENIALTTRVKQRPTTDLFFYKVYFAEVLNQGGFDVVIGNPPYVRHEKIKELKPKLQLEEYKSYNGTADLYIYFFEKGYRLLKENGVLSYITSNKYTRAKYGKQFREFVLKNTNILSYIDFNGVKVFESASVDTSILTYKKSKTKESSFLYCSINEKYKKENQLEKFINKNSFEYLQSDLSMDSFSFANKKELAIKNKIEEIGTPLKEWDIKISSGIKTGFNEAFIIDGKIKDELINKDPKSAEIIKPLIRGKDIKRHSCEYAEKWILTILYNTSNEVKDNYNACYQWLSAFEERLQNKAQVKRGDHHWLELDNNPTIQTVGEFEKEKIIYSEIVQGPQFCLDKNKYYMDMTGFTISGNNLKYLVALLNSSPVTYFFKKFYMGTELGSKGYRYKKAFLVKLPIPKISKEAQKPFEILVDYVMFLKTQNLEEKGIKYQLMPVYFEQIIDGMVYELYFEELLKKHDRDIIKHLGVLPDINEIEDEEKMLILFEVFSRLNNLKHKVRNNLFYMDSIPEIKLIKGK